MSITEAKYVVRHGYDLPESEVEAARRVLNRATVDARRATRMVTA